ncbi:MAG: DUF5678 domain-containing protein [Nanoarchaeota archaeon]|nr:DUF5678 domain-containing protein [Nanoarchaeota archaeon]
MKKIPKKYAGKYVAFINKEIVSSGRTSVEAYKKAKGQFPKRIVSLTYVPTKKETITFL